MGLVPCKLGRLYEGSGGWWLNSGFLGGKLKSGSGTVSTQGSVHIVTVDSMRTNCVLLKQVMGSW